MCGIPQVLEVQQVWGPEGGVGSFRCGVQQVVWDSSGVGFRWRCGIPHVWETSRCGPVQNGSQRVCGLADAFTHVYSLFTTASRVQACVRALGSSAGGRVYAFELLVLTAGRCVCVCSSAGLWVWAPVC